jgi:diadenosine tetraphosphate (Ap4A) HIT family hydrolase/5-methylcytosine-specific restriction endonuclease McrA
MKMMHIYQPVMIKTLIQSNGKVTARKIAKEFLAKDQSQIDYYTEITNNMPGKILRKNKVIEYNKKSKIFELDLSEISSENRNDLVKICDEKIAEYEEKYGKKIWKHRARDSRVISGSIRYRVLTAAKNRCELCGIHKDEKALDVDHVVPINKGGPNVIENMQALCYTCNSQKSDTDSTDFRLWKGMYENRETNCTICKLENLSKISNTLAFTIKDKFPVTKFHYLIIPRRHVDSFFELGTSEQKACLILLSEIKEKLLKEDSTISGFNIGINDSEDSGQTIPHCHIHLIPRRKGDVANPRGGIRNVIPGKSDYGD